MLLELLGELLDLGVGIEVRGIVRFFSSPLIGAATDVVGAATAAPALTPEDKGELLFSGITLPSNEGPAIWGTGPLLLLIDLMALSIRPAGVSVPGPIRPDGALLLIKHVEALDASGVRGSDKSGSGAAIEVAGDIVADDLHDVVIKYDIYLP